jgi:hypothetical protein
MEAKAFVVFRVRTEHIALSPVEPGEHYEFVANPDVSESLGKTVVEHEPGCRRTLISLVGSIFEPYQS